MFTSVLVAALAALPLVASQVPNCARTYNVVEGDTCDGISAAKNSSTYQLATVNNPTIDDACSNLAINQTICLGTTGEDCQTTYIIQPNDTCDAITTNAGINATMLYTNNPQINTDCSNIYVGEVLCTANQVLVPPAPANKPTSSVSVAPGTATAAPAPTQAPASDDDDDDLPWCEDPNDDGEW